MFGDRSLEEACLDVMGRDFFPRMEKQKVYNSKHGPQDGLTAELFLFAGSDSLQTDRLLQVSGFSWGLWSGLPPRQPDMGKPTKTSFSAWGRPRDVPLTDQDPRQSVPLLAFGVMR